MKKVKKKSEKEKVFCIECDYLLNNLNLYHYCKAPSNKKEKFSYYKKGIEDIDLPKNINAKNNCSSFRKIEPKPEPKKSFINIIKYFLKKYLN